MSRRWLGGPQGTVVLVECGDYTSSERNWSSSSRTRKARLNAVRGSGPKCAASIYGMILCPWALSASHLATRSGPEINRGLA